MRSLLGGETRKSFGVIVSAVVDGDVRTTVGYGIIRTALEDAVDALERQGRIERVLAISSPDTIYRDLQWPSRGGLHLPEGQLLARIGRSDLAPTPSSSTGMHKRARALYRQEQLEKRTGRRVLDWVPRIGKQRRKKLARKRVQCRAETLEGTRCKRLTPPGKGWRYCHLHHPK